MIDPELPMRRSLILGFVLTLAAAAAAPAADEFVVIVHPSVVGTSIRRADLAAVFLKKALRWAGGGGLAVPVDQSGTSPVRKAFSQGVLGQPVAQVVQYWQKQMFSSARLIPPPVKGTDAEVIAFVAKNAGGVGYVGVTTPLPPGVKKIDIVD
jgi:ABC-type phosphate transport system substrate-binding protein